MSCSTSTGRSAGATASPSWIIPPRATGESLCLQGRFACRPKSSLPNVPGNPFLPLLGDLQRVLQVEDGVL
jgi:hypothetical protein